MTSHSGKLSWSDALFTAPGLFYRIIAATYKPPSSSLKKLLTFSSCEDALFCIFCISAKRVVFPAASSVPSYIVISMGIHPFSALGRRCQFSSSSPSPLPNSACVDKFIMLQNASGFMHRKRREPSGHSLSSVNFYSLKSNLIFFAFNAANQQR